MKSLKDVIRKVIANKHLGKDMIGAITLNVIRDYFSPKSKVHKVESQGPDDLTTLRPEDCMADKRESEGYVKCNKIFIKTSNQGIKIEIFKKKQDILARVNEALAKVGYATKMVEILIK